LDGELVSEELDNQTLALVSRIMDTHTADAILVQRLWKDRALLTDAVRAIRDWDLLSAEARSLERVDEIVNEALRAVGEGS
jgi:hypothetical protein